MPDGRTIVYPASVNGTLQLLAVSRDGGESRALTREAAHVLHPSVSPDGRWLAATRLTQSKEVRRLRLSALR